MHAEGGGLRPCTVPERGRRLLLSIGVLATVATLTISSGASWATSPPRSAATPLLDQLQRDSGGSAEVVLGPQTGKATFLGGTNARPLAAPVAGPPSTAARRFIDQYGGLFGIANPSSDLAEVRAFTSKSGNSAVRYQQRYAGLPVFAGELAVQVGNAGAVLSTSGEALPNIAVDVTPQVQGAAAADMARALAAKYDNVDLNSVQATTPELWIYDPSLIGADGPPGTRLVWRIEA
jgi:hypothetical protein